MDGCYIMSRALIISPDPVDHHMAGPGVRNWELAHALSKYCDVTLAIPNETRLVSSSVRLVTFDLERGDLRSLAPDSRVFIVRGSVLHFHPYLRELGIPLAVDLYIPDLLEGLVWHAFDDLRTWIPAYEEYLRVQLELLRAGDFFFCASEQQRDYWLGWLHAQKRLNPHTYRQDPTFRRLIDVVPFGLPSTPPRATRPVLRGVHPGIGSDDKIILWSGGMWDWLDPLTVIRAVALLRPAHPELKLYFMGTRPPNPAVSGMSMLDRAVELSRELGLYERAVFFGDWVPYDDRVNYLLEADLAVLSHPNHIETRFSFRTRVLDCIWAGLPLVITRGDAMADLVQSHGIGLAVPPQDIEAMARAMEEVLYRNGGKQACAASFETLRPSFAWDKVIEPLAAFCLQPAHAPDKGQYLTETERIARAKDAFIGALEREIARLGEFEQTLIRYHSLLPFRVYFWLKRRLGKV